MTSLRLAAVAASLFLSLPTWAGDFVDTRLSFVLADDNLLAGPGETTPNSPTPGFGAGNQNNQFFDNFNTRFSGFESLSNLVLYKSGATFIEGLNAEAALTILALERSSGGVDLRDNSSYIRLAYRPSSWGEGEEVSLTGFPVSSDRFRLGYAYRISWAGSSIFTSRATADGVPGVKLQVTRDRWYAFAGMKTAQALNDLILEKERLYGFLAGGGWDPTPWLRLEAGGGYFQKGLVPGLANFGIRAPVDSGGVSAQAVYHLGAPVGISVDFKLYRNDPNVYQRFFAPEQYPGGFQATVSLEGSYLTQTLEDPDEFARTVPQSATAVALQGRFKYNFMRFHLLGLYRTISFIQFDVPGFPPFKDFPDGTSLRPEAFIAAGFDYHFPRFKLTPGFVIGVQQPASFKSPQALLGGNTPPAGLAGQRTVVVRDANQVSVLPTGFDTVPIISAQATFRWDLSDYIAAVGEVFYTRDANRATFRDSVGGIAEPTFEKEDAVGFTAVLQARF